MTNVTGQMTTNQQEKTLAIILEAVGDREKAGSAQLTLQENNRDVENINIYEQDTKDQQHEEDEFSCHHQPTLTNLQMMRFASSFAGYRIVRLSIDLFTIIYLTRIGFSIESAGTVYLIFNFADVTTGIINLFTPTIFVGSVFRGTMFVITITLSLVGGLFCIFFSTNFGIICFGAVIAGSGQSFWYIHFQTIINRSIPRRSADLIANFRLAYDNFGYLLPIIVLALVDTIGSDQPEVIISNSVIGLGMISFFFLILGADLVIASAARIDRDLDVTKKTDKTVGHEELESGDYDTNQYDYDDIDMTKEDESNKEKTRMAKNNITTPSNNTVTLFLRTCFERRIMCVMILNAILSASIASGSGMFGVSTERIFHMESTLLWVSAIAVPFGGAIPVLLFSHKHHDIQGSYHNKIDIRRGFLGVLIFLVGFAGVVTVLLRFSSETRLFPYLSYDGSRRLSMVIMVIYGLSMGFFLGSLMTPIYSLWLRTISAFDVKMISRLSVAFSCIDSAVVGVVFQAHTFLVGAVDNTGSTLPAVTTLSLYGPPVVVYLIGLAALFLLPDSVDDDDDDGGRYKDDGPNKKYGGDQDEKDGLGSISSASTSDMDMMSSFYCPQRKVARHPSVAIPTRSSFVIHDHLHRGSSVGASVRNLFSAQPPSASLPLQGREATKS